MTARTATAPEPSGPGVNLGCRCGLSGAAFQSAVSHLTGVNLSRKMLDKAWERGCHDMLVMGDIETALLRCWSNRGGGDGNGGGGHPNPETKEEKSRKTEARQRQRWRGRRLASHLQPSTLSWCATYSCTWAICALSSGPCGLFPFSAEFLEGKDRDREGDGDAGVREPNPPG